MTVRKIDAVLTRARMPGSTTIANGQGIPRETVWLMALAVGVIIINLTAPQTLIGVIGPDLGIAADRAGLVGTAGLLGYATGLFFLVPLSDLIENRALVIWMLGTAIASAFAAAAIGAALPFLVLLFVLGAASSAIQVLVPIAAAMARPDERGRVVGDVMVGLMIGILVSRPLASLIADVFGWRAFYLVSGAATAALLPLMMSRLPVRRPQAHLGYAALVASLVGLLRTEPTLRRSAATAAMGLAAFTVYWAAIALRLAQAPFGFDQRHVALFALVGAGGAVVAPLAGRAGDRGLSRPLRLAAHLAIVAAFGVAALSGLFEARPWVAVVDLAIAAVVLDLGVFTDQTLGRRSVNLLAPEARGRLNALFVGIFFLGGGLGSAAAGFAWVQGGWPLVCAVGAGFGVLALVAERAFGSEG